MKKETIKKIEENIVKQTTMPEDLKNEVRKDIFKNLLLGIAILFYFIILITGNIDGSKDIATVYFNIYSIFLLIFSIVLIEIAYRKNNGKVAVHGVEILIVAVLTMFLPYALFELSKKQQKFFILSTSLVSAYYLIKCAVINNRAKKLYEKEESDINEITKAQKPNDNLLDEEMDIDKIVRRLQPNSKEEKEKEEPKKVAKRKTTTKSASKAEKKETKTTKTTKASAKKVATKTTTKKEPEVKDVKKTTKKVTSSTNKKTTTSTAKAKKETAKEEPKRRGRPKKVETAEKPTKVENAPKKRGKPRKVVNS